MDASRADGQTVCGYPHSCGQRGVFAALLPEPNRGPDAEEQSSVEHVSGMNCFLSTQQSFPEDTQGFGVFFAVPTEKSQIMKCNEGVILQKDNFHTLAFIR